MNKKLRKTIRLTAISLGALLTVFLLAVTIVVNFIFTPEKLTPVVLNVANQSLNARLQMKSVELTFFFHLSALRTEGDGWGVGV